MLGTEPAALTDVFQQADIELNEDLGADDFASITALEPGVTINGIGTTGSLQSARRSRSLRSSQLQAEGTSGVALQIKFASLGIKGSSGRQQATLNGTASVELGLDTDIQVRFKPQPEVTYARFLPISRQALRLSSQVRQMPNFRRSCA